MFNLIKMDLRRLTRMKSFWIMIVVVLLLGVFSTYMTDYSRNLQQDMDAEADGFFVSVNAQPQLANKVDFTNLVNVDVAGLTLTLLCAIFAPIFVNAEQKNGYIKNIAGQLPNRGVLVLSKLVAVAVQVFVIFASYILAVAVAGKIFLGEDLVFESVGAFAKIIGIHYLLHVGFSALVMALTVMLRGSGLAMTFGILSSATMTSFIYGLINIPLHKCGISESFDIGDYAIENCIYIVRPTMAGDELTRVIVVGIAFLVVSTVAAMVVMQKRDVK